MNTKKQRGQTRRLNTLLEQIDMFVPFECRTEKYEHFHVPSSMFIQSPKTASKTKTAFCKKWLEVTEKFIEQKPTHLPFCKVIAVIDDPNFWNSQIIIFYSQDYYNTFWNRNGPEQTWEKLKNKKISLTKARNITTTLIEKGYIETLSDNNGYYEQSTLWFYGDL